MRDCGKDWGAGTQNRENKERERKWERARADSCLIKTPNKHTSHRYNRKATQTRTHTHSHSLCQIWTYVGQERIIIKSSNSTQCVYNQFRCCMAKNFVRCVSLSLTTVALHWLVLNSNALLLLLWPLFAFFIVHQRRTFLDVGSISDCWFHMDFLMLRDICDFNPNRRFLLRSSTIKIESKSLAVCVNWSQYVKRIYDLINGRTCARLAHRSSYMAFKLGFFWRHSI